MSQMLPNVHCPSKAIILAFNLGELPPSEVDKVYRHLEECVACESMAFQLDQATDPLIHALRLHPSSATASALSVNDTSLVLKTEGRAPKPFEQFGHYKIIKEIGRGGMGVVYLVEDLRLKRPVALKMILGGQFVRGQELRRFQSESELIARLHHPYIVQIYEVGEYQEQPFFALEWVNGGSLAEKLKLERFTPHEAAAFTVKLARAVHYAHTQGIIHRDLKPANVLLQLESAEESHTGKPAIIPTGSSKPLLEYIPKIADFGLAKHLQSDGSLTEPGQVMGTPSYLAPEQASGRKLVGPASDTYSLGAILYELLAGQPPFAGNNPLDILMDVMNKEAVPLSQRIAHVPRDLATITHSCIQKEPEKRYASAAALADDLDRFLEGKPIQARPVSWLERSWLWARRNRAVASLLAMVLLSLIVGTMVSSSFAYTSLQRAEDARQKTEQVMEEKNRTQALQQQAQLKTAELLLLEGQHQAEAGQVDQGMFTMIRAFREAPSDAEAFRRLVRLNFRAWGKHIPQMIWHLDESFGDFGGYLGPDGKQIYAIRENRLFRWNADTGEVIGDHQGKSYANHKIVSVDEIRCRVALLSNPPQKETRKPLLRIVELETGNQIGKSISLEDPTKATSVTFTNQEDYLLFNGAQDAKAFHRFWNLATGQPVGNEIRSNVHYDVVAPMVNTDKRCFLLIGRRAGSFEWFDAQTGKSLDKATPLLRLPAHIAPGDLEYRLLKNNNHLWLVDGNVERAMTWVPPRSHRYSARDLSPDGRILLMNGFDRRLRWFDARTHMPYRESIPVGQHDFFARLNPMGTSTLAATLRNPGVRIYRHESRTGASEESTQQLTTTGAPGGIVYAPNQQTGIVTNSDLIGRGMIRFVDVKTGTDCWQPLVQTSLYPTYSPNGTMIALAKAHDNGIPSVSVYDTSNGSRRFDPFILLQYVHCLAFSADSRYLAAGTVGSVSVWDMKTGQRLHQLKQPGPVVFLHFLNEGKTLLAAGRSGWYGGKPGFHLWNLDTGTLIEKPYITEGAPFVLPSHDRLSFMTIDLHLGELRRWSAVTGQSTGTPLTLELMAKLDMSWEVLQAYSNAFAQASADQTKVACALSDGRVWQWDLNTGRLVGTAYDHGHTVTHLTYSRDGAWLAAACSNNRVLLRDPITNQPVGPWHSFSHRVFGLAFSLDGHRLLVTTEDARTHTIAMPEPAPDDAEYMQLWLETQLGTEQTVVGTTWCNRKKWLAKRLLLEQKATKWIDEQPAIKNESAGWYEEEASRAADCQEWNSALWNIDRAMASDAQAWQLNLRRAEIQIALGNWQLAEIDLRSVIKAGYGAKALAWCQFHASIHRLRQEVDTAKKYDELAKEIQLLWITQR